jgi:superfamily II DNA helicase RecQ
MAFRFFQIPARGCESTENELNGFLASHRILSVDRRWVEHGDNSYWAICVDYQVGGQPNPGSPGTAGSKSRVDYREILPPDEFAVFSELRSLRKEVAEAEGVPVYSVFSNQQLAEMVQRRVIDQAGLKAIPGLGEARLEKYGERFVTFLQSRISGDEKNRESV